MDKYASIAALVAQHLGVSFPAAQIVVRQRGEIVYAKAFGQLGQSPETSEPINPQTPNPTTLDTRFDLASVSKLFTVAAFMRLVEAGDVAIDQRVCEVLPLFRGMRAITPQQDPLGSGTLTEVETNVGSNTHVDAGQITFRHLLTHTSGLPAWLPIWWLAHPARLKLVRPYLREFVLNSSFAYPTGTRIVYSDVGLITLGFAIEQITGQTLDAVVRERVTQPLGLSSVRYGPIAENVAPTEFYAHQGKYMCGEVHDENAWALQGIAGHAGLFATAHDVAAFGQSFLPTASSPQLLTPHTLSEMTHTQAQDGDTQRGLGFALWSPDPEASSHPLSSTSFGHTGFTGTSLWIDPEREWVIAALTNRVFYGRDKGEGIVPFRVALHEALVKIA